MIILGGLTRLTDSGLSIVEWRPITGIIPPLTYQDWLSEFLKYQTFPEYQKHNHNMQLNEFKFIFWLEFIHRFVGRIIGLVYILPLIYFYIKNLIKSHELLFYIFVAILFASQGFIGWYMVQSGLVTNPNVSHFRLAIHLIIAFVIYSLLFWKWMTTTAIVTLLNNVTRNLRTLRIFTILSIIILYVQIFIGGLVAGLRAGLIYNSFPLMGGCFIPSEIKLLDINFSYFSEAVFVQLIHRMNAYILSIIIIIIILYARKTNNKKLHSASNYTMIALSIQMIIGVITILYSVPITLALMHQFGAIILLSCLLFFYFLIQKTK
jgi:cytochrome c oxidase assembly protein subunit 15